MDRGFSLSELMYPLRYAQYKASLNGASSGIPSIPGVAVGAGVLVFCCVGDGAVVDVAVGSVISVGVLVDGVSSTSGTYTGGVVKDFVQPTRVKATKTNIIKAILFIVFPPLFVSDVCVNVLFVWQIGYWFDIIIVIGEKIHFC